VDSDSNVGAVKTTTLLCLLLAGFAAGAVHAQTTNIVTLRANATSASGSLVPTLTWSTSPIANSCTASGGWSGTKAASGTQTLTRIYANTNYILTCTWGTNTARVAWETPTSNTNGSPLTNLAGFRVYYGTSSAALTRTSVVNDITARAASIYSLAPGTWYFAVRAFNTSQIESSNSNLATKIVTAATASANVNIAITSTSSLKATATPVYDLARSPTTGQWVLGRYVGTVAIGTPCRTVYHLSGDYWGVQNGYVTLSVTPRTITLVAHCATS
jgi:hypothetical protein